MTICPNCGSQVQDGSKFCGVCGALITQNEQTPDEQTKICPSCGTPINADADFCPVCGNSAEQVDMMNGYYAPPEVPQNNGKKKFGFKISKKFIVIGSACVALVLVVAIVLTMVIINGGKNSDYALYFKDGEIYYTGTSKSEPWQITTNLFDNYSTYSEPELVLSGLKQYIHVTDDGKMIFYPDKVSAQQEGFSLFCRYLNNPDQEPIKIDSDVVYYSVNKDGNCVTYIKGSDQVLYRHNLTDKEKIDSGVTRFFVSDDGNKIIYYDEEGKLYLKYAGNDKEKIDSDVSYIYYVNEAFNTVYYMKEDSFYKKTEGQDKVKIASGVSYANVINIYESGEIYYEKCDSEEVSLINYVIDDMKETDAAMTEPKRPTYPSSYDYDTYEQYREAREKYETEYDEYLTASQEYYYKEYRDNLRKELADEKVTIDTTTLCYYNGSEEKALTEMDSHVYCSAENSPVIFYGVYDRADIKKVNISDIEYTSEVRDMVNLNQGDHLTYYIAVKDNATSDLEVMDINTTAMDPDGNYMYFTEGTTVGDLYKISISGNAPLKPELYDSDVRSFYLVDEDKLIYSKNMNVNNGLTGDLYINKEEVDYDVFIVSIPQNIRYIENDNAYVFLADWSTDQSNGTLKTFKNGQTTKIKDDVRTFYVTQSGEILYLYDYSASRYEGDLYLYKNGKEEKIDEEVSQIITVNNSKYKGPLYYDDFR